MAFTYAGDPAASSLALLRFLTGDTTSGVHLLEDAEHSYLLTTYGSAQAAAPYALEAMIAKCIGDTLQSADGITRDLAGRREALKARLESLRRTQHLASVAPFVGGTSVAERDNRQEDSDLVQPAFARAQFDFQQGREDEERWP